MRIRKAAKRSNRAFDRLAIACGLDTRRAAKRGPSERQWWGMMLSSISPLPADFRMLLPDQSQRLIEPAIDLRSAAFGDLPPTSLPIQPRLGRQRQHHHGPYRLAEAHNRTSHSPVRA